MQRRSGDRTRSAILHAQPRSDFRVAGSSSEYSKARVEWLCLGGASICRERAPAAPLLFLVQCSIRHPFLSVPRTELEKYISSSHPRLHFPTQATGQHHEVHDHYHDPPPRRDVCARRAHPRDARRMGPKAAVPARRHRLDARRVPQRHLGHERRAREHQQRRRHLPAQGRPHPGGQASRTGL